MADNTFVNIGGHKVSAGIKYSTSEVKTGDVWIDGKPIYRRVFQVTTPADSNYTTVLSLSGYNIKAVISVNGNIEYSTNSTFSLNWWWASNNFFTTCVNSSGIHMQMGTSTGLKSKTAYVAVEYTKTTD